MAKCCIGTSWERLTSYLSHTHILVSLVNYCGLGGALRPASRARTPGGLSAPAPRPKSREAFGAPLPPVAVSELLSSLARRGQAAAGVEGAYVYMLEFTALL